ncbi:MAG: hypothetical protein JW850_19355 [Thermoflexales bacterium]|nr:hypothetical protein [Thermoflexales bacterium]
MHRNAFYLIGLSLALAACGGGTATPAPTATSQAAATSTAPPTATVAQVATSALPSQPSSFKLNPAAACQPAGKPASVPGLSPVGADDWIKGSPSAPVTLMEYADYQ